MVTIQKEEGFVYKPVSFHWKSVFVLIQMKLINSLSFIFRAYWKWSNIYS